MLQHWPLLVAFAQMISVKSHVLAGADQGFLELRGFICIRWGGGGGYFAVRPKLFHFQGIFKNGGGAGRGV